MATTSSTSAKKTGKKVVHQQPLIADPMDIEKESYAQAVQSAPPKETLYLFRTPKHFTALTGHDHLVLDLLWKDHHGAGFLTAMNTLAGHLQALRYMKTLPPSTTMPPKLEPQTLEAYIAKEFKITALEKELGLLKTQIEELKAEKAKAETEAQLLLQTWNYEMEAEWANSQSRIPPRLYPAKQQIYELLKKKQHSNFLKVISYLKKIDARELSKPRGLHLTMISMQRKEAHPNEPHCQCDKGFTIIKAAIDLTQWEDCQLLDIKVSLLDLLNYGLLDRLVVHMLHLDKIANLPWKLRYCLEKFYKLHDLHGYVDLNISSSPPWFLGYPTDAKHQILIKIQRDWMPDFWDSSFQTEVQKTSKVPLDLQVNLWRDYTLSAAPIIFDQATLVSEDKTMKIFVEDPNDAFYTPFASHFCTTPGYYEHFNQTKGEAYITEYKNYGTIVAAANDDDDDILAELQDDD